MPQLSVGELCAGYGGLGMAVEHIFDARLAWVSEFEAAPSKILAHHWPDVPNYGDMTAIDWANIEPVDIISGGTPCQDLSAAGKRRGMTEGTRSNLWANMREAIAIIQPRYVVWENVRGAYSATATSDLEFCPGCMGNPHDRKSALRALGRVLGDLSDLGYDCQWRGLRAADVGAPHGRFRVFILATHRDGGRNGWGPALTGDGESTEPDTETDRADDRPGQPRPTENPGPPNPADLGREGHRPGGQNTGHRAAAGRRTPPADRHDAGITLRSVPGEQEHGPAEPSGPVHDPSGRRRDETVEHDGSGAAPENGTGVPDQSDRVTGRTGSQRGQTPENADLPVGGERRVPAPRKAERGRARGDAGRRSRTPARDTTRSVGDESPAAGPGEHQGQRRAEPPRGPNIVAPHPGRPTIGEHTGGTPQEETRPESGDRPGDPGGKQPARVRRETAPHPDRVRRGQGRAKQSRVEGRRDPLRDGDATPAPAPHPESVRRDDGHPVDVGAAGGRIHVPGDTGDAPTGAPGTPETDWGEYEPAIRRWEQTLGRRAPAPTEPTGRNGGHRLSARFAEWMMGVPDGWIVDVPGVSRNEALKAAGNGVVPQQAAAALLHMITHR